MLFEDLIIGESATVQDVMERLKNVKCEVVYVLDSGKLKASVSNGDVERYIKSGKSTKESIKEIANYYPRYFNQFELTYASGIFDTIIFMSMPVVNYNRELVEVIFKDGRRIRKGKKIDCPVVMMTGGKGTRLYPYTKILPKALVPIGEIPISERILDNFEKYGCTDIYMIVNYKKDMICAYFNVQDKNYKISYIEEEQPLGTGGGLYLLDGKIDETFFLVNCDVFIDADYEEIYDYHIRKDNYITIVAAKYHNVIPYGVVSCCEDEGFVGIEEKPSMEYLINTGMYIVDSRLLSVMPKNKELGFPEIIKLMQVQGNKIGVYVIEESAYMDMGQLEELEKMKKKMGV